MGSDYVLIKDFLTGAIFSRHVRSVFVAGSFADEIVPGSDLDLFIIVHKKHLNSFLNSFSRKLKLFIDKNPSFIYTFFRGPIKFENKKLIHCVIYTDGKVGNVSDFQNEPPQVFEGILNKYEVLIGEDPKIIAPEMNLNEPSRNERESYMRQKAKYFWDEGKVVYREWVKVGESWKFERKTIELTGWQKEHLKKYFEEYKPVSN